MLQAVYQTMVVILLLQIVLNLALIFAMQSRHTDDPISCFPDLRSQTHLLLLLVFT